MTDLLPCPFCGSAPSIEPWHGGGPRKRYISCDSEDCPANPSATGSTEARAIEAWNTRAAPPLAAATVGLTDAEPSREVIDAMMTVDGRLGPATCYALYEAARLATRLPAAATWTQEQVDTVEREAAMLATKVREPKFAAATPSAQCIWPDCGHDTNQSNPDPRCNGKFCPKPAATPSAGDAS